ncbi:hypothetical protein P8452_55804 [Trifolium repens]|nr:hypothetical protein P8452_55804 [Trifolium repens]
MIWEGITGMAFIGDLHFGKVTSTLCQMWSEATVFLLFDTGNLLINGGWGVIRSRKRKIKHKERPSQEATGNRDDDENASIHCGRAEAVMRDGGIRLLLGLAKSCWEGLQSEAAKAIANLSVNANVAKAVEEEGGIEILASLARAQGAIAEAGGLQALMDLIFKWSSTGDVVLERADGALAADDKCGTEVALAGGVHALVMLPRNCKYEILIRSEQGTMQLWNINTEKKIFEFKGWDSPISCIVSSPALDVVAVGCADGKIHVHNIRYDQELVKFTHATRGSVTALSFSTDGQPLLASGGSSGVISIWNLEKKRLHSVVREAHDGVITSLHFFANEPVLMSSSANNSIKMWIFDTSDGDPRLLRFRSGYSAPPLCIKFYANGRHFLSAGQDRAFRLFRLTNAHSRVVEWRLDVEGEHWLPRFLAEIRERDWCNVVTCHMDTVQAYVWRLQNFVLGKHLLTPCPENPTPVKACAISACGNFAILGTAGGWIEKFNLQSRIHRGVYIDMSESRSCAHDSEVVGVACDSTNTLMISAGYQGHIKVTQIV